jgi:hypothetical protein
LYYSDKGAVAVQKLKEMKSFKEMQRRVNEYFAVCQEQDVFPDEAGLILHLGISEEMYEAYRTRDRRRYIPFRRCLEDAQLRRESILVRAIYSSDKKSAAGKIFLARLEENGGLSEQELTAKPESKQALEVKFSPGARQYFE